MKRLALASVALLALGASASAQTPTPATQKSIAITISTATTTQLIAPPAVPSAAITPSIYVTAVDIIAAGTGNIQFIAGTGATCGTGTVNITGNYNLTAQVGFTKGNGAGVVWVVPPGLGLCAVTSGAVGMPGSLAYATF